MTKPHEQFKLALTAHQAGRLREAEAAYEAVLTAASNHLGAHANLAACLCQQGRHADALRAVARARSHGGASTNLDNAEGLAARALGQTAQAIAAFQAALEIEPGFAEARANLGLCLVDAGRVREGAAECRRAAAEAPHSATAFTNLGVALSALGDAKGAEAACRTAVANAPHALEARRNLARLLTERGDLEGAAEELSALLSRAPDDPIANGQRAYLRRRLCDWRGYDADAAKFAAAVAQGAPGAQPFAALALTDDPALLRSSISAYARTLGTAPATPRTALRAGGKIRVGVAAPSFRRHPMAALMTEAFARLDRSDFELHGYSWGAKGEESEERRRLLAAFDHVTEIDDLSDEAAAAKIAADGIDVLIDRNGYTQNARFGIFQRRPAPVQLAFIAFPGPMAAPWIDAAIVDGVIAPEGAETGYSERLIRLPGCYLPRETRFSADLPAANRAAAGLPESAPVLAALGQSYKITPDRFALWMRLLRDHPSAVLWLLREHAATMENLRAAALSAGVAPARLIFAPRLEQEAHIARHIHVTATLDTAPYGAHTGASDTLWMRRPVVTLPGRSYASRVAASLLTAAELPELIARDETEYVEIAAALLQGGAFADAVAAKLTSIRDSRLFNMPRYAKELGDALLALHKTKMTDI